MAEHQKETEAPNPGRRIVENLAVAPSLGAVVAVLR